LPDSVAEAEGFGFDDRLLDGLDEPSIMASLTILGDRRATMAKRKPLSENPAPNYDFVEEFVELNTCHRHTCVICEEDFGQGLEPQVNHYLRQHKFKILHICQEATRDEWTLTTVYVGGRSAQPGPDGSPTE
jgi:hypothetical protein